MRRMFEICFVVAMDRTFQIERPQCCEWTDISCNSINGIAGLTHQMPCLPAEGWLRRSHVLDGPD